MIARVRLLGHAHLHRWVTPAASPAPPGPTHPLLALASEVLTSRSGARSRSGGLALDVDRDLYDLAARQHGHLTVGQARRAGLSIAAIKHRVDSGVWTRLRPTVLGITGAPATEESRLVLAALDAGPEAFISHTTAAAHWEIPGFDTSPVHVTRARATTARPARGTIIHEPRLLPASHTTVHRGVPVLTPVRTIFDLAAIASPSKVERALDTAWSRRLVSGRLLHQTLHELAERGRTGIGVMRQLLGERPAGYRPMDSGTEVRARDLLRRAGIRGFEHQIDLGDEVEWIGRVDLVDRQRRIVIEIDSDRYHGALIDRRADAERTRRLEAAGYVVRRVTDTTVWHHPQQFLEMVREAVWAAAARNPASGT